MSFMWNLYYVCRHRNIVNMFFWLCNLIESQDADYHVHICLLMANFRLNWVRWREALWGEAGGNAYIIWVITWVFMFKRLGRKSWLSCCLLEALSPVGIMSYKGVLIKPAQELLSLCCSWVCTSLCMQSESHEAKTAVHLTASLWSHKFVYTYIEVVWLLCL